MIGINEAVNNRQFVQLDVKDENVFNSQDNTWCSLVGRTHSYNMHTSI